MLTLRASFADKLNTDYSIFVTFKYNPYYVEIMKSMPNRVWNGDTKEWEIAYSNYSQLIGTLNSNNIPYNGSEFMKSISDLSKMVQQMQEMKNKEADIDSSILDNVEFKTNPFPYQKDGIAYGLNIGNFLLADDQGLGKALALDTPILTTQGWKLLKDINLQDKLFDEKGNPCNIINIYYHKNKNMYKVTFTDNSEVICCDEHLWKVYTSNKEKCTTNPYKVMQLKDIQKDYLLKYNYKYYIPMCEPINFDKKLLPIHPYVMGALLGDGCFIHGISFTTVDEFILKKINSLLHSGYILKQKKKLIDYQLVNINNLSTKKTQKNYYKECLKQLKLYNCNSHHKFIPNIFKYSNVEDRLHLLQGLMDTDGYISKKGTMQFTSCCERLCDDVAELIESLGGTFKKRQKIIKQKFKAWELTFKLKSGLQPVSLPRKVERIIKKRKYEPIRNIKNIQYIGQQDAICLTVDSPNNLFIIKNYIVTHNTLQASNIARLKQGGKHCLVICGYDSLQFNWVREIETHTNEKAMVLGQRTKKNGRVYLGKLPERYEDLQNLDKIEEFFVIMSATTLRQCQKQEYINKKGKKAYNKIFYMADLIEEWCRRGEIGRIIVDEFQVFKNYDSLQTQALLRTKSCPYKIAATGTPLMNKNIDLFPLFTWLGYERKNYWEFRERYCKLGGFKGKEIIGDKNTPELHQRLSQFMLRRKKEDVLDLPEKIFIDEVLEMDGKQWALYEKMQKLTKAQLSQMKGNKALLLSATLNLRKITCHPGWVDETYKDSVKYERVRQIVHEAYENKRKTIIFSCFTTPFESQLECLNLYNMLKLYNPAMIIGATKDRMAEVDKFQNDDSCYVIVGSIGAMGTGLTLNKASNVIFMDEPWNRALKDQACDRAHRIGTKNNVNIYTLICKGTVDESVHKTVMKKGRLADQIIDGVTVEELEDILGGNI